MEQGIDNKVNISYYNIYAFFRGGGHSVLSFKNNNTVYILLMVLFRELLSYLSTKSVKYLTDTPNNGY